MALLDIEGSYFHDANVGHEIKSRALTSHTYNQETARAVAHSIRITYFGEFVKLQARLETLSRQAG